MKRNRRIRENVLFSDHNEDNKRYPLTSYNQRHSTQSPMQPIQPTTDFPTTQPTQTTQHTTMQHTVQFTTQYSSQNFFVPQREYTQNFMETNFNEEFPKQNLHKVPSVSDGLSNPNEYEPVVDEVPLLEELGINFSNIFKNILLVLNPLKNTDPNILNDIDLAGPLLICLCLGFALLLKGKIHFGYIYGVGTCGCIGIYLLLNLMCPSGVQIHRIVCILGYCLLPMVFLAIFSAILPWFLKSWTISAFIATAIAIGWSTWSAAGMFVTSLNMEKQKWLVAYPVGMLYITFAMLTLF